MLVRASLVALLLHTTCAHALASPGPPPDPSSGESFDGRTHGPGWRDDALLVPRLVLAVPRLVLRLVWWPIGAAVRFVEARQIHRKVYAALTSEDGLTGVVPVFDVVTGLRSTFGLTYFNERALGPGTELRVSLLGSFGDIFLAGARVRPTRASRAVEYIGGVAFAHRDDFLFTGIGFEQARTLPQTRYQADVLDVENEVRLRLSPAVSLYFGGIFGLRNFGNGAQIGDELPIARVYCRRVLEQFCSELQIDEALVPGFTNGTRFLRGAVALRVDTHDVPHRPASGAFLWLGADYSHGLGSTDPSSYLRAYGDLGAALDLWQRSRILVVRVSVAMAVPLGDAPVPFSELPTLGGPDSLRGARLWRFRDFSSLLASVEYRWPVWMWADAVLFADYGGVFAKNFSNFSFDFMVPAVGVGIRVRTARRFFARLQLAYGWGEGWQLSLVGSADPL